MTTKDSHILNFWYAKLSELQCANEKPVTSGELGRYVGQSRNTAKRYLDRLVGEKVVAKSKLKFPNGVTGVTYQVIEK